MTFISREDDDPRVRDRTPNPWEAFPGRVTTLALAHCPRNAAGTHGRVPRVVGLLLTPLTFRSGLSRTTLARSLRVKGAHSDRDAASCPLARLFVAFARP